MQTRFRTQRRILRGSILCVVVALAGLSTVACKKEEPVAARTMLRPVRVDRVKASGGRESRTFSGMAKAGSESRLSFKGGGTLSVLKVKVGDKVKKGDLIAAVEGRDSSLRAQEAKAALDQAKSGARNARSQYKRVRGLYESNTATAQDLDTARTAEESARAGVAVATKRLALAQSRAGDSRLKSPVDGTIAQVPVELGENVGAGQAVVLVESGKRVEVEISVPEALITRVKHGSSAKVKFQSAGGAIFDATITEVGVTGGAATTFPVVVRLEKEDERLRSGMVAEVTLAFGDSDGPPKLYVQPKAVREDAAGRFAFVAIPEPDGKTAKVQRRKLTTGAIGSEGLEVKSGLKAGELLVTAGLTYLEDGLRVKLPGAVQGAAAPAGSAKPPAAAPSSKTAPAPSGDGSP